MTRDQLDWLGCDLDGCTTEMTGPGRTLDDTATRAGWVHKLVTQHFHDQREVWQDWCPPHADQQYARWAADYTAAYGSGPWPDAVTNARIRVTADIAAAPARAIRQPWQPTISNADVDPATILTAIVLLVGAWTRFDRVVQIGREVAETVKIFRWGRSSATTLPASAIDALDTSERAILDRLRDPGRDEWDRWTACQSRAVADLDTIF